MKSSLLLVACLFFLIACGGSPQTTTQQTPSPTPEQKSSPKTMTAADLQRLRWIEGSWKGTGDIDKPF